MNKKFHGFSSVTVSYDVILNFDSVQCLSSILGQSVPHVHIHILPRHSSDFEPVDAVYDKLEEVDLETDFHTYNDTQSKKREAKLKMDSDRKPVSMHPITYNIFTSDKVVVEYF